MDDIWAFSIDQTFDLSLRAASLSVSLQRIWFRRNSSGGGSCCSDAIAGEIREGGRQRIWSRCYCRPSEDPGFHFSKKNSKILNRHFSRIASSPIPVPRSSWRPQANECFVIEVVSVVVIADSNLFHILILCFLMPKIYILTGDREFRESFVQGKAVTEQISFDHCCSACCSFPWYCRALLQSVCL